MDKPKNYIMNKLILLFTLIVIFISSSVFAQITQITGITRGKTSVFFGPGNKTLEKIPGNQTVSIIDADDQYFTIKYNDGKAYVNRTDLKFSYSELRELNKTKKMATSDSKFSNQLKELPSASGSFKLSGTDITKVDDKYKYEIDHIRYCAGKYNQQIMTGYLLSITGSVVVGGGSFTDKPKVPLAIGAGLSLIGGILIIDGQKWMKKISIGPDGIGIKYAF